MSTLQPGEERICDNKKDGGAKKQRSMENYHIRELRKGTTKLISNACDRMQTLHCIAECCVYDRTTQTNMI